MTFSPHGFNSEMILKSATSGASNHNELKLFHKVNGSFTERYSSNDDMSQN
jgi:hypothetical protein